MNEKTKVVYIVTRFNQIFGAYESADDANVVVKESVAKGLLCKCEAVAIVPQSKSK